MRCVKAREAPPQVMRARVSWRVSFQTTKSCEWKPERISSGGLVGEMGVVKRADSRLGPSGGRAAWRRVRLRDVVRDVVVVVIS